MHVNQEGLELIKSFEGCKLKAYRCPAGVWTIGYGHTSAAGKPHVHQDLKITKKEAEEILKCDLVKYENAVVNYLWDCWKNLNSNQFSALVSLCYNIGPTAFGRSSVVRDIRANRITEAAEKILYWNKSRGKVLRGLVKRREAERELYLS